MILILLFLILLILLLILLLWLLLLRMIIIFLTLLLLPRTKVYTDLIIICMFAKPWPFVEPNVTLSLGKFSVEKIEEFGHVGLKWWTSGTHALTLLPLLVCWSMTKSLEKDEEIKEVGLGGFRQVTKSFSDAQTLTLTLNSRG